MKNTVRRIIAAVLCAVSFSFVLVSCSDGLDGHYKYDLSEYVELPSDLSAITLTEGEILAKVEAKKNEALYNNAAETHLLEEGAGSGDIVSVSFKCYHYETYSEDKENDNFIASISDPSCRIKLGDGKYPFELESKLVGKAVGDTFEVEAVLPATYTVDGLGGSRVIYRGEVVGITTLVIPEYNDEFVKKVSTCATVEEYEQMLYTEMKKQLAWEKLLEATNIISYPTPELNSHISNFRIQYNAIASDEELTIDEYVAKKFFITPADFSSKAEAYAKEIVKSEMTLYHYARSNGIGLTSAEYEAGIQKYVSQYGFDSVGELESRFGKLYAQQTVLMDKVLEDLANKITYKNDIEL